MTASVEAVPRRQVHVLAGTIAMVLGVGTLDYLTGSEASIALLYLIPIAIASWMVGLRAGLLLCGLSAVIRLQDLWLTIHAFSHPVTFYWNTVVELGFFVVVAGTVARLRSTTDRETMLARVDPLTGLFNRRAFIELAAREVARAERYDQSLSIAYLDVDDFKRVNDEGGHGEGDRLLVESAEILKSNLRSSDVVSRYGGDEFVLLLPDTNAEAGLAVLDKLMTRLRTSHRAPSSTTTFSIGAVSIDGPRTTLDRLIHQADNLVYAAKEAGGNCIRHRHLNRGGTSDDGPASTSPAGPGGGHPYVHGELSQVPHMKAG